MNHPISDALTANEARECLACLLQGVELHDSGGDARALLAAVLQTTDRAAALAHGVPDDQHWPDPLEAKRAAALANSRARDKVLWIDGKTTGDWAAITGLAAATIRKRWQRGIRPPALFEPGRVAA
ncbi:MAG: hypothetical protein PF501_18995 [Salinisphaera sp.]|jgi:membrane-associated protease RseP (regulator of RpoE activity)|nr:hypothetical protein [Salinisphaera sp.]